MIRGHLCCSQIFLCIASYFLSLGRFSISRKIIPQCRVCIFIKIISSECVQYKNNLNIHLQTATMFYRNHKKKLQCLMTVVQKYENGQLTSFQSCVQKPSHQKLQKVILKGSQMTYRFWNRDFQGERRFVFLSICCANYSGHLTKLYSTSNATLKKCNRYSS